MAGPKPKTKSKLSIEEIAKRKEEGQKKTRDNLRGEKTKRKLNKKIQKTNKKKAKNANERRKLTLTNGQNIGSKSTTNTSAAAPTKSPTSNSSESPRINVVQGTVAPIKTETPPNKTIGNTLAVSSLAKAASTSKRGPPPLPSDENLAKAWNAEKSILSRSNTPNLIKTAELATAASALAPPPPPPPPPPPKQQQPDTPFVKGNLLNITKIKPVQGSTNTAGPTLKLTGFNTSSSTNTDGPKLNIEGVTKNAVSTNTAGPKLTLAGVNTSSSTNNNPYVPLVKANTNKKKLSSRSEKRAKRKANAKTEKNAKELLSEMPFSNLSNIPQKTKKKQNIEGITKNSTNTNTPPKKTNETVNTKTTGVDNVATPKANITSNSTTPRNTSYATPPRQNFISNTISTQGSMQEFPIGNTVANGKKKVKLTKKIRRKESQLKRELKKQEKDSKIQFFRDIIGVDFKFDIVKRYLNFLPEELGKNKLTREQKINVLQQGMQQIQQELGAIEQRIQSQQASPRDLRQQRFLMHEQLKGNEALEMIRLQEAKTNTLKTESQNESNA